VGTIAERIAIIIRVKDNRFYLFLFLFSFLFSLPFILDLGLEVRVTSHVTVTNYHIFITCNSYDHIITHHIEECRRFQNNDIILHINSIYYILFRLG